MRPADTINVTLAPEMLQAVRESVEAGEYASPPSGARIRRSLDDPRPPLSLKEVEARIEGLHAETVKAHRDAS
ncbi:type II toxin-antitoxin system ParD family antitoxin [Methylobacterium organophilum]|uniref:Type II toxin-antitoxin system ParD family antitoxin n=1 Tax=Methylobacterium organophilum TaxID=410 RepID=A0ABQ4T260_METOR|nr:type II toxin-antitoxin system ParD family antitoxin [Methylobacterium organophilum]GJE25603.1 hypothetical protein LKMONMHP_0441 [Methylobacterium organophilum]